MNGASPPIMLSPVSRWVRILAVFTVVLAAALIALGGFVTSFRVGMADPVWPTQPWYLLNNTNWNFGFVIEHSHRLAGWMLGASITVLAVAIWWTEPKRELRWYGLAAILGLLVCYGQFHRGMGEAWVELKDLAKAERNLDPQSPNFESGVANAKLPEKVKSWPSISGTMAALFAVAAVICGVISGFSNSFGSWLRCCALVGLVAVMIQGLLGGFRVFFNALAGANLAAIHGTFGQTTFCVLLAIAMLAANRRPNDALADADRAEFSKLAWWLVALLGLQLVWAVMLRHTGSAIAQRLHMLTAFLATAAIIGLVLRIQSQSGPREILGKASYFLAGLLALQLLLGVEAYMGKFAAIGPQAQTPPEFRAVSIDQAVTRSVHQLVGCGLLAVAVAIAIRATRQPLLIHYETALKEAGVPGVAMLAMSRGDEAPRESRAPDVALMAITTPEEGVRETRAPDVARMAINPPDDGLLR